MNFLGFARQRRVGAHGTCTCNKKDVLAPKGRRRLKCTWNLKFADSIGSDRVDRTPAHAKYSSIINSKAKSLSFEDLSEYACLVWLFHDLCDHLVRYSNCGKEAIAWKRGSRLWQCRISSAWNLSKCRVFSWKSNWKLSERFQEAELCYNLLFVFLLPDNAEIVFLAFFFVEMMFKLFGLGINQYFSSSFNCFDCAVSGPFLLYITFWAQPWHQSPNSKPL